MKRPTLSVVMCNRNHARFIRGALDAILGQSYPPLEVIVVDDASTDDSIELLRDFARREPKVQIVRNKANLGVVSAANRGFERAAGDYVYSGGADDRVLPGFFEATMRLLASYPGAGLCCTDPAYFDDGVGVLRAARLRLADRPAYLADEELVKRIRQRRIGIPGHTAVVKRTAFKEAGWLMADLKWHSDWFAMLIVGFRCGVCYVPEPLAAMRFAASSFSSSGVKLSHAQRGVLLQLLRTLTASACDVASDFRRSGVLGSFGVGILPMLLKNRDFWRFVNLALVGWLLQGCGKNAVLRFTPARLKDLYRNLREDGLGHTASLARVRIDP